MKKLFIILCAFSLVLTATGQHGRYYGRGGYIRPRVSVGIGYGYVPFSPYYAYPWYGYPPTYGYAYRPSKLELKIDDIKADYKDRIWSARHSDLPRRERKNQIHELKRERDQKISDLKRNYYKTSEY